MAQPFRPAAPVATAPMGTALHTPSSWAPAGSRHPRRWHPTPPQSTLQGRASGSEAWQGRAADRHLSSAASSKLPLAACGSVQADRTHPPSLAPKWDSRSGTAGQRDMSGHARLSGQLITWRRQRSPASMAMVGSAPSYPLPTTSSRSRPSFLAAAAQALRRTMAMRWSCRPAMVASGRAWYRRSDTAAPSTASPSQVSLHRKGSGGQAGRAGKG